MFVAEDSSEVLLELTKSGFVVENRVLFECFSKELSVSGWPQRNAKKRHPHHRSS